MFCWRQLRQLRQGLLASPHRTRIITMTISENGGFRRDINGLRALAVIAVVFYHFHVPAFGGGFVGVDIFFTISGYLMTRMIVGGIVSGTFSLSEFYLARARRIVPALLVMSAILLAIAWFLPLAAHEYRLLAKHVRDSVLFVSNLTYAREAGYFDTSAHEKWLLHTWSLSVEWQFYLLLPLLILGLRKISRSIPLHYLFLVLAVISLALGIYRTAINPSDAFFLLPFRAWELLAGGLVYLLLEHHAVPRRQAEIMATAAVLALLLNCFLLSAADPWPGWRAMLPVFASCLVIAMRDGGSRFLGNPLAQWLGLRSYSIYLWHWPFVVGLALYGWQGNVLGIGIALGVTLFAGDISYRYVETPFRKHMGGYRPRNAWWVIAVAVAVVVVPASWLQGQSTLPSRTSAMNAAARLADESPFDNSGRPECFDGSLDEGCLYRPPVGVLMVGDSHAGVTVTSLLRAVSEKAWGVQLWAKGGCMTVLDVQGGEGAEGSRCQAFNTRVYERIRSAPKGIPLVVANRGSIYPFGLFRVETHLPGRPQATVPGFSPDDKKAFLDVYRRRVIDTACLYVKTDRPVYYVLPIPEFAVNIPNELTRMLMRRQDSSGEITLPLAEYLARNAFVIEALKDARDQCGVKLLDPTEYLCRDGKCFGSQDGLPLFTDNNHLNERGRRLLSPMFKPVIQ